MNIASESIDVIPAPALPSEPEKFADARDKSVTAAFLLPSTEADAEVVPLQQNRATPYALAISALAFLRTARGLPLTELEVSVNGIIYDVFADEGSGRVGIILPKCKQIVTNSHTYADETEVEYRIVAVSGGTVQLVRCRDARLFSDDRLLVLPRPVGKLAGAAAWSVSEGEVLLSCPRQTRVLPIVHALASLIARQFPALLPCPVNAGCEARAFYLSSLGNEVILSVKAPRAPLFYSPLE